MTPDEIRTLVRLIEERQSQVELRPGTLVEVNNNQGVVSLDGSTVNIGVNIAADVQLDDRVMVMFVPPRGAYVISRMGSPEPDRACPVWVSIFQSERAHFVSIDGSLTITLPDWAQEFRQYQLRLTGSSIEAGGAFQTMNINESTSNHVVAGTIGVLKGDGTLGASTDFGGTDEFYVSRWHGRPSNSSIVEIQRDLFYASVMANGHRGGWTGFDPVEDNERFIANGTVVVSGADAGISDASIRTITLAGTQTIYQSVVLLGLDPCGTGEPIPEEEPT